MYSICPLPDVPLELRSNIYFFVLHAAFRPYYFLPKRPQDAQVFLCRNDEAVYSFTPAH